MENVGRKAIFKEFEIIKKIYLFPEYFTVENSLMTPTMKIRRDVAKKYFEKIVNLLYNE